jgi:hypothetical protein
MYCWLFCSCLSTLQFINQWCISLGISILFLENNFVLKWLCHLRSIVNAPWYVSNELLHNDLHIVSVTDEIQRVATKYNSKTHNHADDRIEHLYNNGLIDDFVEPGRKTSYNTETMFHKEKPQWRILPSTSPPCPRLQHIYLMDR